MAAAHSAAHIGLSRTAESCGRLMLHGRFLQEALNGLRRAELVDDLGQGRRRHHLPAVIPRRQCLSGLRTGSEMIVEGRVQGSDGTSVAADHIVDAAILSMKMPSSSDEGLTPASPS